MSTFVSGHRYAGMVVDLDRRSIEREDDAFFDRCFRHDAVIHRPDGDVGVTEVKAFFAAMRTALPDLTVQRPHILVEGDNLAARAIIAGTFSSPLKLPDGSLFAPTRKIIQFSVNNFLLFQDDQIVEEWVLVDNLGFLTALGAQMDIRT